MPEFGPPTATMVADLLRAGAVRVTKEKPFYVSPLDTVGKGEPGSGKYRLILDLRVLNKAMRKYKFRMETLARRRWMFVPGGWMISADLTSAYQHVNINEKHCKYLGFEWEGQWYEFATLPFGGDFAPWAFTELSKQITTFFRRCGVKCLHYLDDFLFVAHTKKAAAKLAQFIVRVFQAAGFMLNLAKSYLVPSQRLQSLGFIVDLQRFCVSLIPKRVVELVKTIGRLRVAFETNIATPVKEVAKVCGTLASMSLVLGSQIRTFCFFLQRVIDSAPTWGSFVQGSLEAIFELRFFERLLSSTTELPLATARFFHDCVFETDASDSQFAGVLRNNAGKVVWKVKRVLTASQAAASSTFREFITYRGVLTPLRKVLRGLNVLIRTDSLCARNIWHKGSSRVAKIHKEVVELFFFLISNGIKVSIEWWPRYLNQVADDASKHCERFDWCIAHSVFEAANRAYGPFTIDRFASRENRVATGRGFRQTRLPFMSEFHELGSMGNAFTFPWNVDDNSWCFPGFNNIQGCIARMLEQCARGALVIPEHRSSLWWNDLFLPNGRPRSFIVDVWTVDRFDRVVYDFTTRGRVITHSDFNLIIVFFDCRHSALPDMVGAEPAAFTGR